MDISQRALDIIESFEGLRLNAYLDPVGIPTIGYGTIAYPNGRKVEMGDSISDAEASAFLKFDCDRVCKDVDEAVDGIALAQNQYDALVSFTYNVGIGALLGSTLLKKLRVNDFVGAAAEFSQWNKGYVNGIKQEIDGLTKRRAQERALFEQQASPGAPLSTPQSNVECAVAAKGFRKGNANVLVAYDAKAAVVEIFEFEDSSPLTIIAAIKTYPNLVSFDFAGVNETVPDASLVNFSGLSQPILKAKKIPKLARTLLVYGVEDSEDPPGDDVKNMQTRLADLGYYFGPIDGIFGVLTDRAARQFQADYFGRSEADGKVGPKTWAKLFGDSQPSKPDAGVPAPGKNYLKLVKTDTKDEFGCYILTLANYADGVFAGSINVCSGQPRKQTFRTGAESPAQSMEPLPEGQWSVGDIRWCGGKDVYTGPVWSSGLGPAVMSLEYVGPGKTARAAIEIHIDWNRDKAPGTAGCVGILNIADHKTLVGWTRATNPRFLYVDWGLGTCPKP